MSTRLAAFLLLLPVCSLADSVVPIDTVENHVNIRLEPDAMSDVVGRLTQGARLELVSEIDGWYEVVLEGDATGFVSADWTDVIRDEPVVASAESEPPGPGVEPQPVAIELPPEPDPEPVAEPAPETVLSTPADPLVLKGKRDYLMRFRDEAAGVASQIFDDGNRIGIGTSTPKQRLEVNGSIQIHEQNSSVAGLMITQSSGETGYIMHNRASTLTIGAGSQDRITIVRDGSVGIGVSRPDHPLELASGAHVTQAGVWTNRSSRADKENIEVIEAGEAVDALMALRPVLYEHRSGDAETYAGFIAEEVPELVAMQDRASLSAMDIVAVLTRVVQEQQIRINELERRLTRD